jgi:hypothetical protein
MSTKPGTAIQNQDSATTELSSRPAKSPGTRGQGPPYPRELNTRPLAGHSAHSDGPKRPGHYVRVSLLCVPHVRTGPIAGSVTTLPSGRGRPVTPKAPPQPSQTSYTTEPEFKAHTTLRPWPVKNSSHTGNSRQQPTCAFVSQVTSVVGTVTGSNNTSSRSEAPAAHGSRTRARPTCSAGCSTSSP